MNENDNRFRVLASAARSTAQGMADAVAGMADDCKVSVRGSHFRVIATMLGRLADAIETDVACDCMGKPIDGIRFWVPQDRFNLEHARAERLATEVAELREVLRFSGDLIAY